MYLTTRIRAGIHTFAGRALSSNASLVKVPGPKYDWHPHISLDNHTENINHEGNFQIKRVWLPLSAPQRSVLEILYCRRGDPKRPDLLLEVRPSVCARYHCAAYDRAGDAENRGGSACGKLSDGGSRSRSLTLSRVRASDLSTGGPAPGESACPGADVWYRVCSVGWPPPAPGDQPLPATLLRILLLPDRSQQ